MKNFKEKEVKDLSSILGGQNDPKVSTINIRINFTIYWDGVFDGSLRQGIINEFDKQSNKPVVTLQNS